MHITIYGNLIKITFLTLAFWLTGVFNIFSQEYLFDLEFIGVEDGLPHRNTYNIIQDNDGFIWVSTLEGISRYDGYRFKNYNHKDLNTSEFGLPYKLAIDAANRLWYFSRNAAEGEQSYGGIINSHRDSISPIETLSGQYFTTKDILYIGNTQPEHTDILIVTRSGSIYTYDTGFKELYRFSYPLSDQVNYQANPDGSYWITHGKEAIQLKDGKQLRHITADYNIKRIITTYPKLIIELYADLKSDFWSLENEAFVPFAPEGHKPEDIKGLLWFHKDYNCYTTKDRLFVKDTLGNIMYSFNDFKSLKFQRELAFEGSFLDRQNILWASTINGLLKISSRKNPFKIVAPKYSTRAIYREGEQLWIGHAGNVVRNMVKGTQKKIWPFRVVPINSFCKDDKGNIWMGTDLNALMKYIPDQDRYIRYYIESSKRSRLHHIFQNSVTATYWVGTRNGIFRLNMDNEAFRTDTAANDSIVIKDKNVLIPLALPNTSKGVSVKQFYQNAAGIWIVTNKGIFLMDARREVIIKHYTEADGLPTNEFKHLHEDAAGIFWLGTKRDGLIRWDIKTNSFTQYNQKNGLTNNRIYAVYEDDYETLWLPSDYGLMAFDKTTATVTKVYLPQNGIAHEEFNTFSHFQDKDGALYFGGLNGVTIFHPRDLREEKTTAPPLYATGVRILKKDAESFTDETSTYKKTQKISLDPGDRILELDLSLLDYKNSAENQYAYKLSGKQERWIYTGESKLAIINPTYGSYDLEIKARSASGQWSENHLIIPLHVKRPFYLQWWFILTVALITTISIFKGVRWRVQKLKKDRIYLEKEVEKRTREIAQDKETIEAQARELKTLDEAKNRFFANITHEFRTPLTLVTGPVEQIIAERLPEHIKKRLKSVLKNANNLLELINQLLDISKLESDRMKIEIFRGDIMRYTKELVEHFQPLVHKKELQLDFASHTGQWKTHFDKDKWNKIVYNLVSNAIKYTRKGGIITVRLQQQKELPQEYIHLEVEDTGVGIKPEHLDHIFDRFYQADDSTTRIHEGTGIGLSLVKELVAFQNGNISVKSSRGVGTTFTVRLPVAKDHAVEDTIPLSFEEVLPLPVLTTPWVENKETALTVNGGKEKMKLLIIEDNAEMRAYIHSCIDTSTYHISEATNGAEGIAKAQEIVPDLIISDIMMPEKDGFEVTRSIRNHIATSHIPLILLTAKASLESRLEGLERGADAYLTKPFSPRELAMRIKKLIEFRKFLQQRYQNQEHPPQENTVFQKEDCFISELRTYIITHSSEPDLGVEAISKHFGISRVQIYRKLKALINTSVAHYIRTVRLEKALGLLNEKKLNITEVAYETGFSPSNFSKAFKKVYGRSPSEAC